MQIKKRDGTLVPFDEMKIRQAVLKALKAVGLPAASIAKKVAKDVVETLSDVEVPDVELIQDRVETALMKRGLWQAARAYILYRDEHAKAREQLKVRKLGKKGQSVTDQALMLVQSMTNNEVSAWDRQRITKRIEEATGLSHDKAAEIAKTVEETVIATGLQTVNSAFIRELVNSVLIDKGYSAQLKDLTMFSVPKDFIDSLMHAKSEENSNIVSNTPESVAFEIASLAFKQYANNAIFSEDIKNAHTTGAIQLHDLNFPARVYAFSGNGTALLVRFNGYVKIMTIKDLWDAVDVPVEQLNETQVGKDMTNQSVEIQDRGSWVRVNRLVLSNELKQGVRIKLKSGTVQSVTAEHGVFVRRGDKYLIVRADEVKTSDKLVRIV